jgi:hypothetical protein
MESASSHSSENSRRSFPRSNNLGMQADEAGVGAKFDAIEHHFKILKETGLNFGYFPKSSKSILMRSRL